MFKSLWDPLFPYALISLLITLLSFSPSLAQDKFTVSGYVKDAATGEDLIGANVYLKELMKGGSANQYGFFSITVEQGKYTLVVSFVGYKDTSMAINLDKNIRLNLTLSRHAVEGKEVEITGERSDKNVLSTRMSAEEMQVEKIKALPAIFGEVDVLKTIQLLPGVQSSGEGNAGYYVRGGGPDQNLILLDEAVVYNASHLFGFFSVFNSDAINSVTLIKGGMPANYGGRLASVLDITMKEGNAKRFQAEGGIGLISSRLTLQGPIKKDTCSFITSGRRTYIDVLTKPFIKKSSPFRGSGYYFYDLNTKINYRLSDKDRLFLSGYFGRDIFTYNNSESAFDVHIPWGNATASFRWNHLFNDKMFMNTTVIFSDYDFGMEAGQDQFTFKLRSGIQDWNGKMDFNYFPNVRHNIKFGGNYIYHTFVPSSISAKSGDVQVAPEKIVKYYAHEGALYITDDFDWTDKLALNTGLRYSAFTHTGPYNRFLKDELGHITDTIRYNNMKPVKTYIGLEPRISLRYSINMKSSVKASYTRNHQYMHLASLASVTLPTDVWMPSTLNIKPQIGTQYAVGYFRNFMENVFESSIELYYKTMKNLIEYKDGALPEDNVNDNPDNAFTFGEGEAYGAEFFLKKRTGKLNGWIGYTLSSTTRQFDELNGGKKFFAKYDRRHDISVVAIYDLSAKWTFSAVFVYGTGNAITLPVGRYFIEGRIMNEFGPRNWYRMAPYHRADVSATYTRKKRERFESSWNFSIYNLYSRKNPYFIYYDETGDLVKGTLNVRAKQVSLFPIMPSVTWNFKL